MSVIWVFLLGAVVAFAGLFVWFERRDRRSLENHLARTRPPDWPASTAPGELDGTVPAVFDAAAVPEEPVRAGDGHRQASARTRPPPDAERR